MGKNSQQKGYKRTLIALVLLSGDEKWCITAMDIVKSYCFNDFRRDVTTICKVNLQMQIVGRATTSYRQLSNYDSGRDRF
jgi:hypothetical protein